MFLLVFCFSCQNKNKDILPEEKLADVIADMHLADAILNRESTRFGQKDSLHSYYNTLYAQHNISRKQFYQTMQHYMKNPAEFDKIYSQVLNKLRDKQALYKPKSDSLQNKKEEIKKVENKIIEKEKLMKTLIK